MDTVSEREPPQKKSWSARLPVKGAFVFGSVMAVAGAVLTFPLLDRTSAAVLTLALALVSALTGYILMTVLVSSRLRALARTVANVRDLGAQGDDRRHPTGDELDAMAWAVGDASRAVSERINRLRRIENYRQEFLGDVSHELQTPIYAVEGFAETLLEGALEDPTVNRSFVEKIHRNARRLSALVNDLSDISQIETGSLRMNLISFDPKQLAHESVEALEMSAEHSGIRLHIFIAQGIRFVVGDRERVRQVLLNLLTNGIRYNNPGGSVELALWQITGDEVIFSVTDDGIGIAADQIPRVTERFFRVDKSRSRERGGTGLGLAIVKHIVEAHGSTLLIQSRPGHGSTFSFALPAAASSNSPQTQRRESA